MYYLVLSETCGALIVINKAKTIKLRESEGKQKREKADRKLLPAGGIKGRGAGQEPEGQEAGTQTCLSGEAGVIQKIHPQAERGQRMKEEILWRDRLLNIQNSVLPVPTIMGKVNVPTPLILRFTSSGPEVLTDMP